MARTRHHWQRGLAAATLLVVLTGCSAGPPATPQVKGSTVSMSTKVTFITRLIGFCAGVNRTLAKSGSDPAPSLVAEELEGLIQKAMAQGPPTQDRGKFDAFMTALLSAATQFRQASDAAAAGDDAAAATALAGAGKAQSAADAAAVSYGMPHLQNCDSKDPYGTMTTTAGWRTAAKAPLAVQQAATAVLDGNIWVIGGVVDGKATTKIEIYDPVMGGWSPGPDLPIPLHHAMAVFYRGELVVIGGFATSGNDLMGVTLTTVYRLVDGKTWAAMPPLQHARAAGAAAAVGDRIVVTAGRSTTELVPSTEVFDGQAWHDAAPIPVPGDHLGVASDGQLLYAVGGRRLVPGTDTGALQRFDVRTRQWTQLPPMPTPRGGLGAALVDGRIIAAGGEAAASTSATVEAYDVAGNSWSSLPALATARHGMSVAAANHSVYAIAGAQRPGHLNASDLVERLDLSAPPASPAATPTPTATATASSIFTCPKDHAAHWVCLTSAKAKNGALVLKYTTNFSPSATLDRGHYHLHLYTANPDGKGGTSPPAGVMMHVANMGSWFNIYDKNVQRIDGSTVLSGQKKPLDLQHFSLLCARVASGLHELQRDDKGGLGSGNCVKITR